MNDNSKIVALAWAPHQDHVEIDAKRLNARLYFIHYLAYQKPLFAPVKYVLQTFKTWLVLLRERPAIVYILNPPFFAPLTVWVFCVLSGARMIMASHYSALYGVKWKWSLSITRFLARHALVNIVDQKRNKQLFESWNAKAVIWEKCPSTQFVPGEEIVMPNGRFSITVINTFAEDDPVDVILDAAAQCPDVDWYVLGDPARAPRGLLARAPSNVTFTGYLFKADYWNRLYRANVILALTTRAYSMMAGALDGLSIGKPLILSRQPTLVEYFTRGVVFVENDAGSIVRGLKEFQKLERRLVDEIASLRDEKISRWEDSFAQLQKIIAQNT